MKNKIPAYISDLKKLIIKLGGKGRFQINEYLIREISEPFADMFFENPGVFQKSDIVLKDECFPASMCHQNSLSYAACYDNAEFWSGFALSDKVWRVHSWVIQDKKVIECTPIARERYIGVHITKKKDFNNFFGFPSSPKEIRLLLKNKGLKKQSNPKNIFPTIKNKTNSLKLKLILGDCLEKLKDIPDEFVHLICVDLPYGTTQNKWDEIIPFDQMWNSFNRILKNDGIIVLTATQPFSSKLVMSNLDNFKYEIIWEKTIGSGQLNIKKQPLRVHESILIFYKTPGTYNEQKTEGKPYSIKRKVNFKGEGYGKQTNSEKNNDGFRHARSIIKISNPRIKGGHPTQKPLELMEYLIKTYSNENDVVLDCCMGSGTTGVASRNLKRKFIGIELNETYYMSSKLRIIDNYNGK